MPQYQSTKADKPIHCIACGKVIGQGFIEAGSIKLLCKCGIKTTIEAETKPEGRVKYFVAGNKRPDGTYEAVEMNR